MTGSRKFLTLIALGCIGLMASACASSLGWDQGSDLERTWDEAILVLPANNGEEPSVENLKNVKITTELARIAPGRRWPVVVYMHGCTGIGNFSFFQRIARAGYVVVAPNSMARRYRPLQCDPRSKTGGYNLFVYDFRMAEISYALQQLSQAPWSDSENLFLIGASEGGVAAALYRGNAFNARIIAQWTCQGAPLVRGIAAPPETPVLSVVRADDPWYDPTRAVNQRGDCGTFLNGRPESRSIVARGTEHDVLKDVQLVQQMVEFLDRHRR